jgi:hypothetical protein
VHFLIAPEEGLLAIDNQPLNIDMSSMPKNISIIAYNCSNGVGQVEYNDRLKLFDWFGDVSPYIQFLNKWLTVAAALTATPLTLPQSKYVQIGLVDALYNSKRQAPIAALGYNWDASDPAVAAMQAALASWDVVAAASAADAALAQSVNGMTIDTQTVQNPGPPGGQTWTSTSTHSGINAPGMALGPTVFWPTYNYTALVQLTMAQMRVIIDQIHQRQMNLDSVRQSKETAIKLKTSIADVIAYDIVSGW